MPPQNLNDNPTRPKAAVKTTNKSSDYLAAQQAALRLAQAAAAKKGPPAQPAYVPTAQPVAPVTPPRYVPTAQPTSSNNYRPAPAPVREPASPYYNPPAPRPTAAWQAEQAKPNTQRPAGPPPPPSWTGFTTQDQTEIGNLVNKMRNPQQSAQEYINQFLAQQKQVQGPPTTGTNVLPTARQHTTTRSITAPASGPLPYQDQQDFAYLLARMQGNPGASAPGIAPIPPAPKLFGTDQIGIGALANLWTSTPGYTAAQIRSQQRHAEDVNATPYESFGWTPAPPDASLWGQAGNVLGNIANNAGVLWRNDQRAPVVGKAFETVNDYGGDILDYVFSPMSSIAVTGQLPGVGSSAGELLSSTWDTLVTPPSLERNGLRPSWEQEQEGYLGLNTLWNDLKQNLQGFAEVRQHLAYMSPEIRRTASLGLLNVLSGPDSAMNAVVAISNQQQEVDTMRQQAEKLYLQANDPASPLSTEQRQQAGLQAAYLGAEATRLAQRTPLDLAEQYQTWWRQLGGEALLDPTNLVGPVVKLLGLGTEARRIRQAQNIVNAADKEMLARAFETTIAAKARGLVGTKANTFIQNVNPFRLTPESRAITAADAWFRVFGSVFGSVDNTADAQALMKVLTENPTQLLDGVRGLVSPEIVNAVGATGELKIGEGLLANRDVVNNLDALIEATDALKNLPSLREGKFNIISFVAEATDAIQDAAKRIHGVKDKANPLRKIDSLQRAFMSEVWLNMRPGHWIRNAASAAGHLITDDIMTFAPTDRLVGNLRNKFGGAMPTPRLGEAVGDIEMSRTISALSGMETGKKSDLRNIPLVGNPLGAFAEFGGRVWSGNTSLFSRLPVGEQNFYIRAYSVPFQRHFERLWNEAVVGNLMPALTGAGIDDALAAGLADVVRETARYGSRDDVISAYRAAIEGSHVPFSLRSLGITDPALSDDGYHALMTAIRNTQDPATLQAEINRIFDSEATIYNALLQDAPPQMGRYAFTDMESVQDGAEYVTQMRRAAKEMGLDVVQTQQEAQAVADQVRQSLDFALSALREEAVRSGNHNAFSVALDTFAQLMEERSQIRQDLATWASQAIDPDSGYSWSDYFTQAQRRWGEFPTRIQEVTDQARLALRSGTTVQRDSVWSYLERSARRVDEELAAIRKLQPGAPSDPRMTQVIDASRQYVDSYLARAYTAFARFPSQDSLDIMLSAERDLSRLGGQAAAHVERLRDELFANAISLEKFYQERNQTWFDLAEAQAMRLRITVREMATEGIAAETLNDLRYTSLDGQQWRIVNQTDDGYLVRNVETGGLRFTDNLPQEVEKAYTEAMAQLHSRTDSFVNQMGDIPESIGDGGRFNLDGDNLEDAILEVNRGRASSGVTWTPETGDMAAYWRDLQEKARRLLVDNVGRIVSPGEKAVSDAQRLRALDAMSRMLPVWDNVTETAARGARSVADFAMLDFGQRRNVDKWISLFVPYHYWFTRSAYNWLERTMTKPSILSQYLRINREMEKENRGLPQRLQGTLPVPGAATMMQALGLPVGPDETLRVRNPLRYIIPYDVYAGNEWADPDAARSGLERYLETAKMFGFGLLPAYDAAYQVWRGKGETIQLGDFVPQYRSLNYIYQAITGESLPSAGDEFDQYRNAREVALRVFRGELSPQMGQFAQDVAYQIMNSVGPLPEQPADARKAYEAAAKKSGFDRGLAIVGAYLLGIPAYLYTDTEADAAKVAELYHLVGWSPEDNPTGAKAARKDILADNPALTTWWSKGDVVPSQGNDSPPVPIGTMNPLRPGQAASTATALTGGWPYKFPSSGPGRPGATAVRNMLFDERQGLYATRQQAVDAYLLQHPNATWQEVAKVRANFEDGIEDTTARIDNLDNQYPGQFDSYSGMNPYETAVEATQQAVKRAKTELEGKRPKSPGEGATGAQWAQYFAQRKAYEQELADLVERYTASPKALSDNARGRPVDEAAYDAAIQGRTAAEIIKDYDQRFMSEVERA